MVAFLVQAKVSTHWVAVLRVLPHPASKQMRRVFQPIPKDKGPDRPMSGGLNKTRTCRRLLKQTWSLVYSFLWSSRSTIETSQNVKRNSILKTTQSISLGNLPLKSPPKYSKSNPAWMKYINKRRTPKIQKLVLIQSQGRRLWFSIILTNQP